MSLSQENHLLPPLYFLHDGEHCYEMFQTLLYLAHLLLYTRNFWIGRLNV